MEYKSTIGLEIHAELKTKTKMFCNSANKTERAKPNTNICPICMAHPGTLPTINKEAVRHVLKVGVALSGELADITSFDRKNYFYPDIPKGYQISQYKYPLVSGGSLKGTKITRVHLEEDTARSTHHEGHSLVDYNRAGVPLMELVTEPVIKSAEHAVVFAKELQLLLRYLGVSDANMEKGEMRVEANISVSKTDTFGTKVEVKNLNSFKSVEKAIRYEISRHIKSLENGEKIIQETRGWDEDKDKTFSQRIKETSDDYRYFPDPDLPKLKISEVPEFAEDVLREELPELPWERRDRLSSDYNLGEEAVEFLVTDRFLGGIFDAVALELNENKDGIRLASNYITSDLVNLLEDQREKKINFEPANFAKLIEMIQEKKVSSRGAKNTLASMVKKGGDPEEIAEREGLLQKSDKGELGGVVEGIIKANPTAVSDYKGGNENALQFLVGQGMKETRGSANPELLKELFTSYLK